MDSSKLHELNKNYHIYILYVSQTKDLPLLEDLSSRVIKIVEPLYNATVRKYGALLMMMTLIFGTVILDIIFTL